MKKIIYLFLVAYGIVFLILYNDYGALVVLITALLLPLCLKAVTTTLRKNTKVRLKRSCQFTEQGEDVEVKIHISNQSLVFPITNGVVYLEYKNLFSGDKNKKRIPFHVKANHEVLILAKWKAKHCGRMKIRIQSIRIYDYFGIFYAKLRMTKSNKNLKSWENDRIIVPGYLELTVDSGLALLESEGDGNLYSKHTKGEDPSEIFSIREYKEGDKLHRIHWNLSYKRNQYMVKEYSLPLVCAVTILLDFSKLKKEKRKYDYMDAMLKMAFSLSFAYVQEKLLHYVVWYDKNLQAPTRRLIEREEDIHEAFQEILTTPRLIEEESLREAYFQKYGKDRQYVVYYISKKEDVVNADEMLERLSCKKIEWIQIMEDVKKEKHTNHLNLEPVRIREFGFRRLDEDVREWLVSG